MSSEQTINGYKVVNPDAYKWKVLLAAFLAYSFDIGDMTAVSIATPLLIKEWGLTTASAGLISSCNLFGAAIGAFIWGPISDTVGRKRAYIYCLAWYTLLNVATIFCSNLLSIGLVRFLCGLGLGGAWILGSTLVTEFFPPEQRAKASSIVQSSAIVGMLIILFSTVYLVPIFTWRAVFGIGALALFVILYFIFCIPESPAWIKTKFGQEKTAKTPEEPLKLSELFSKSYIRPVFFGSFLTSALLVAYWGSAAWIPSFLTVEKGLNLKEMSGYMAALYAGGFFSYFVYGYFADKYGRRITYIITPILAGIVTLIFMYCTTAANALIIAALFGFATSGIFGPLGAYIGEQYPTAIRGTGVAFTWGVARFFAALAPVVLGGLAMITSLQFCIGLMAAVFISGAVATLFLKETKGKVIA